MALFREGMSGGRRAIARVEEPFFGKNEIERRGRASDHVVAIVQTVAAEQEQNVRVLKVLGRDREDELPASVPRLL